MKYIIFILITMFFTLSSGAQVRQEVISSAGEYNVSGGFSVSWTLGETIIPIYKNGNLTLAHGFQQQLVITAIEENLDVPVNVKIFPNPADEVLNIQFEAPVEKQVVITIIDFKGELIKTDIIESTMTEKQINLQNFPPGVYFIRLTKGGLVNVYKVVKL
jgi:hypothetical protein